MAGDEQVFYASLIGDMWSLVLTGGDRYHRLVKHQPNASSGGIVAHNIENFLAAHYGLQHDALSQLIGTMVGEERDRKVVSEAV